MYSGWLLTNFSGNILGAHQKIDRVAHKHVLELLKDSKYFPSVKQILHFEGINGPDGVKRKSPAKDEPWHYYDPFDPNDNQLIDLIEGHYNNLVKELQKRNMTKAGFEAAWLAHALVDGLTPAHHFPFEEELEKLRGESLETRTSFKSKVYIKGDTRLDSVKKNWAYWGAKGLFTTHYMFEFGFSTVIVPLKLTKAKPTKEDLARMQKFGIAEYFRQIAREVALMNTYEDFYEKGWTPRLARKVRKELAPLITKSVTLSWHAAVLEATKADS